MNKYETLLIEDKKALEKELEKLYTQSFGKSPSGLEAVREIDKIAKVIDYEVRFSFDVHWEPSQGEIYGRLTTDDLNILYSNEDWGSETDFYTLSRKYDIDWDGCVEYGTASTDYNCLSRVDVVINGTTEKADEECRKLWKHKMIQEARQRKLDEIVRLNNQIKSLELELALELA